MVQDAAIYGADEVMLDLEDSIPISEKDAARKLIKNALNDLEFKQVQVGVRINPLATEFGQLDLEAVVPAGPDVLRVPKVESAADIQELDKQLGELEKKSGLKKGAVKVVPLLETARGVQSASEIAEAAPRITALAMGGEDLTADIGCARTREGRELFTIRSQVVLAASAAGIEALDTVYSNIDDIAGLIEETKLVKELGFAGKSVLHPQQIKPVHEVFNPTDEEVQEAKRIVAAAEEAEKRGSGATTVDGKMIDKPVIKRARRILIRAGLVKEEKKDENK